jgi:hypothetical protein
MKRVLPRSGAERKATKECRVTSFSHMTIGI